MSCLLLFNWTITLSKLGSLKQQAINRTNLWTQREFCPVTAINSLRPPDWRAKNSIWPVYHTMSSCLIWIVNSQALHLKLAPLYKTIVHCNVENHLFALGPPSQRPCWWYIPFLLRGFCPVIVINTLRSWNRQGINFEGLPHNVQP